MAASNRTYAAAHFALELDDKESVGLFRSIEGGGLRADVMTYQQGGNYDRWRQLGKPKYEDLKLQVGMAMSEPFYIWIQDFFDGKVNRKTGAIVAADFYYNERARREFKEAIIKELTFPKLEGNDKNPAYMTIGIAVEDITFVKPKGDAKLAAPDGFDKQKLWTARNFTFTVAGFEAACKRTSKIESFTVKHNIIEHHVGGQRAPIKTPSPIDFPNIVFHVPEADAGAFTDYAKKSIADGEKPGQLHGSLITYDHQKRTLFTLEFMMADVISVTPDCSDSSTEDTKHVKVELYTEKMTFKYAAKNATP